MDPGNDLRPDELASGREEPTRVRRMSPRLQQALVVAAGLVAAALLAPGLLSAQRVDAPAGAKSKRGPAAMTSSPTASARPGPLAWKTRGNLAADDTFVAAVLKRVRRDHPGAASVLFAGGVPEGDRLALVAVSHQVPASPVDEVADVLAVTAGPGETLDDAQIASVGGLDPVARIVGWAGRASNGRIYAVVLGPPVPLDAELSAFIDYRADGSATRDWQRLHSRNGVAVVDLGMRSDPAVAVRSRSPDARPTFLLIDVWRRGQPPDQLAVPDVEAVHGLTSRSYAGPEPTSATLILARAVNTLLDVMEADLRVLWSGRLAEAPSALVRARRPDGPTFHVFMSEDPTSGDPSMLDVRRVPWSAGDVMPWVGPDPGSGDRDQPVLVVNPTGAGSVVVQAEDGRRVNVRLGRNGVARFGERLSVFDLTGATITLRTPAGRTVLREELPKLYGQDVSLFN